MVRISTIEQKAGLYQGLINKSVNGTENRALTNTQNEKVRAVLIAHAKLILRKLDKNLANSK